MLEVYQIKKTYTPDTCYFIARFTVSAYRNNNNMTKTEQRLPKQQQMNKTKLNPPDTQHQPLCRN